MKNKTLLTKDGYLLDKKTFQTDFLDKIKNELTVEPYNFGFSFGTKEKDNTFFKVFRETDDYLIIPKYYGLEKLGAPTKNKEIVGEPIKIDFKGDLRDSQKNIINQVIPHLEEKDGGLICLGCGGGKCLAKDTPILMFDGSIKMVQDIELDDVIMGDDSEPRNVLSVTQGRETMYQIINKDNNNESYTVNESHILSLYNINEDEIYDINVIDYLNLIDKKDYLGYRVPITFEEKELEIEPYLFGTLLDNNNNFNDIYIPLEYKCNSRENQLELLAGILDSIGVKDDDCYKVYSNHFNFLSDILFIARSLGLEAYLNEYNVCLTINDNLAEIPVRIIPPVKSKMIENNLTYPIEIVKQEEDDYYGFEIDGNNRFVLGDFTVTHNTVLALYIAAHFKVKTLIIVHKSFLLNQWKERISQFTNANIGIIQQNKTEVDGKDIVIGMIQSIAKEKYDVDIFRDFGLVIFDEAHHAPSKYFSRALPLIASKKTLALSATPKRSDKLEKVLYWYFGPIIYKNEAEENKTVLCKIYKYSIEHEKFVEKKQRFTGEVNRPGTISNIVTIGRRNRFIIDLVEDILEDDRKIMILSERIEHLELLKKRLDERELATTGFYIGGMKQKKLDESANCQVIFGTYAMASEALDIKGLNTLVMASPRREIEQTIGRITRDPEPKVRPLVIDITDNLDVFIRQSFARRQFYRKNGFQIILHDVVDNKIISEEDITITHTHTQEKSIKVVEEEADFIDV